MQNPKEVIIKTLDIIGYEKDKDQFAEEFLSACKKQAVVNLIKNLSPEKQEEFKDKIAEAQDEQTISILFKAFFDEEAYNQALGKATEDTFRKYLDIIIPNLNAAKKSQLKQLFESYTYLEKKKAVEDAYATKTVLMTGWKHFKY